MSYIQAGGGSSGRTILTGLKEYYVAIGGSDSNPGTLASPWATIQHAMNFIAGNVDQAGNLARINVGTGTFVGVGLKQVLGGPLEIKGNGVANTFIGNGPNDGVFNHGECVAIYTAAFCQYWLNNFTCQPTTHTGGGMIYMNTGFNNIVIGEDQDGAGASGALNFDDTAGTALNCINLFGPNAQLLDSSIAINSFKLINTTGGFIVCDLAEAFIIGHYTVTGNPAIALAWVQVYDGSLLVDFGATWTGTATGQRFIVGVDSVIDNGDTTGTVYPGSTVGSLMPNSVYAGIMNYDGNVAGLPTATIANARAFVNNALAPAFGAIVAGGGAIYTPVYADGTNWRCG